MRGSISAAVTDTDSWRPSADPQDWAASPPLKGESTLPSANANVTALDSYGHSMPLPLTLKESKLLEIFVCLPRETRRRASAGDTLWKLHKEDLKCLLTDFSAPPGWIAEPSRVALFPIES